MELVYQNKSTKELKGEIFKPYPLNNQYLASNYGRVKSKQQVIKHNHGGIAIKKERILTQTDNGSGYLSVGLTEEGKTKTVRVSRIIATTFIENPFNKPQVNHIDGVKYNNYAVNLEWNTCGENVRHAWNNGLAKKQNSFLYIQQRMEVINQYIAFRPRVSTPIGLGTIIIDQNCYRIEYDNSKLENLVKSIRFWQDDFKLIVRDLSDLTKEIEIDGVKFVPMIELVKIKHPKEEIRVNVSSAKNCYSIWYEFEDEKHTIRDRIYVYTQTFDTDYVCSIKTTEYWIIQKLLSWHFDCFNLLENNLAIDINTI